MHTDPDLSTSRAATLVLLHPISRSFAAVTQQCLRAIAWGRHPLPPDMAADLVARARRVAGMEAR
jgi:hypothetical protein